MPRVEGPVKSKMDHTGKLPGRTLFTPWCAMLQTGRRPNPGDGLWRTRRNGCGHPNSLKIGANTAAHHIEILLLNVFQKF